MILTGWSISLVAGIPLAAFVSDIYGWRAVFILLAAIAAITAIGFLQLPKPPRLETSNGLASLLGPLWINTVPRLLTICLCYMVAFYGVYAFLGDHIRTLHDISAGQTSAIVLAYGIGFGLASFGDGIIDRMGPRRVLPWSLLAIAMAYAIMAPAATYFPAIVALGIYWGFANHFALNIIVLLLSEAEPKMRGAILGINSAVTYFGALIGATLFGEIYARFGFWVLPALGALMVAAAALLAGKVPKFE